MDASVFLLMVMVMAYSYDLTSDVPKMVRAGLLRLADLRDVPGQRGIRLLERFELTLEIIR